MSNTVNAVSVRPVNALLTAIALDPPAWTRLEPQSVTGRSDARAGSARPRSAVAAYPPVAVRRIPGRRCRHAVRRDLPGLAASASLHGGRALRSPTTPHGRCPPVSRSIHRSSASRLAARPGPASTRGGRLAADRCIGRSGIRRARGAVEGMRACARCATALRCPAADMERAADFIARSLVHVRTLSLPRRRSKPVHPLGCKARLRQHWTPRTNGWRWYRANVSPLAAGTPDSWFAERLEYRFAIRAGSADKQLVFNAPLHDGGTIDWYTFDHRPGAKLALANEGTPQPATSRELNMIATPLRYPGMPADRLWQFEDGRSTSACSRRRSHDLARLASSSSRPSTAATGSSCRSTSTPGSFTTLDDLSYLTTFGERFGVTPPTTRGRSGRFRMFQVSIAGQDASLGPAGTAERARYAEGRALEEVLFLRDESANMAWALEKTCPRRAGDPRSRGDEPRTDLVPTGPTTTRGAQVHPRDHGAEVLDPAGPVSTNARGGFELRKGTVTDHDESLGSSSIPRRSR